MTMPINNKQLEKFVNPAFEEALNRHFWGKRRADQLNLLLEKGFPTPKNEMWRWSPWNRIFEIPYNPNFKTSFSHYSFPYEMACHSPFVSKEHILLPFINGQLLGKSFPMEEAFCIKAVSELKEDELDLLPQPESVLATEFHPLIALNSIYLQNGLHICILKNQKLITPLHILHIDKSPSNASASHLRHYIEISENANATILISSASQNLTPSWLNQVIIIDLKDHAELELIVFIDQGSKSVDFTAIIGKMGSFSKLRLFYLIAGSYFSRLETIINHSEPYGQCHINGLFLSKGSSAIDQHIIVSHLAPECISRQQINGLVFDDSYALLHGKIIAFPNANRTDAILTNKNLILSPTARIQTQPQLEIYANDVKCTHGANVGHIDEESLFYLRSRGISKEKAKELLIYGFTQEIIERLENTERQNQLYGWLQQFLTQR